jgi:hypothetical protein
MLTMLNGNYPNNFTCFPHRRQSHLCSAVGRGLETQRTEIIGRDPLELGFQESQKADVPASFKEKNLLTISQSAEA